MSTLTINNYELKHFDLKAKDVMNKYLSLINVDVVIILLLVIIFGFQQLLVFIQLLNETFCLFILNSGEMSMLLPPIGKKNTYEAMIQCFEIMNSHNSNRNYSKIEYVHEELLEGFVDYLEEGTLVYEMLKDFIIEKKLGWLYLSNRRFNWTKGDSYKSKRNEINRFKSLSKF